MRGKTLTLLLIPLILTILFSAITMLPFYQTFENRVYDLFLSIKPEVEEDERLLLLDVDDLAISEVGVWPWSRDIMANGLVLLREFDAEYIVFDIEYTEESPRGVNSIVLREEVPELFEKEFGAILDNISGLFGALAAGQIPLEEAEGYIGDLRQLTEESRQILLKKIQEIERDNDEFLGAAARLNGHSFFTVGMLTEEDPGVPHSLVEYAEEHLPLNNVSGENPMLRSAEGLRPCIYPILSKARSAGFPNVKVDDDGVRRRIDLLMKYNGKYFPQLAFSPLLRWLGMPEIELGEQSIILKGAEHPDRGKKDISIPLTEDGFVLINWPHSTYEESFRHMSYYELVYNRELEQRLVENLRIMNDAGYLSYHDGDFPLLDAYNYAAGIRSEVLDGGDPELMDEYAEVRRQFFTELENFLNGSVEAAINADIASALDSGQLDEATAGAYRDIQAEVPEVFSAAREVSKNLTASRSRLAEAIPGSFIIIGHVGTSTTDIGVTPFAKEYMNVGTHAALINTILQENFLDELPEWYSIILALVISLLAALLIWKMTPVYSLITGTVFLIVLVGADMGVFVGTGLYFPPVIPMFSLFFTFIALTAVQFIRTARDRAYIRNAFSHYLSTDVINDLLSDPDKLSLGGDKKYMTALFTDVRGFSTISEQLDPKELVGLLNLYLTEMSDIILDHKGTIDKYEGDAIICFFGAPIEYTDHAERACLSAIRMKKVEKDLNRRFVEEQLSPAPVLTRVGINTGEMVVGNMGTAQKMDYTIMGNSVNLAARLEGVNKQYGTWILVSETTFKEGGPKIVGRRLDRVRVVGIKEPVRLYELVDEKSSIDSSTMEALEIFHNGLEAFEAREWKKARGIFRQVLDILPDDGPARFYIGRCDKFKKKAPPDNWDGVFNLTLK
jgi:adenylate cyclase